MTQMTDERINRVLAEFMKLKEAYPCPIAFAAGYTPYELPDGTTGKFDPRNDANHALMVLEKWRVPNNYDKPYVEIELDNGVWNIVLQHKIRNRTYTDYKEVAEATNKSFCHTITDALMQAVGGAE